MCYVLMKCYHFNAHDLLYSCLNFVGVWLNLINMKLRWGIYVLPGTNDWVVYGNLNWEGRQFISVFQNIPDTAVMLIFMEALRDNVILSS